MCLSGCTRNISKKYHVLRNTSLNKQTLCTKKSITARKFNTMTRKLSSIVSNLWVAADSEPPFDLDFGPSYSSLSWASACWISCSARPTAAKKRAFNSVQFLSARAKPPGCFLSFGSLNLLTKSRSSCFTRPSLFNAASNSRCSRCMKHRIARLSSGKTPNNIRIILNLFFCSPEHLGMGGIMAKVRICMYISIYIYGCVFLYIYIYILYIYMHVI